MSLEYLNAESYQRKQCHGVREASRTVTVRYMKNCVSWLLQSLRCKKRQS